MEIKNRITLTILTLFLILSIITPSIASEVSAPGSPELDAMVYGSNELTPGDAVQLSVLLQNSGVLNSVDTSTSTIANLSITAIDLTVELEEKSSVPITIKTDKLLIGALPSMYPYPPVSFSIEVDKDAKPGMYNIPLVLRYKRLEGVTLTGGGTGMNYYYKNEKKTINLEVKVKENFDLLVEEVKTSNMYGGSSGNLELTIKNNGYETAYDAVLTITPTTPSTTGGSSETSSMDLSSLSSLSQMSSLSGLLSASGSSSSTTASTPFTPTTSIFIGDIEPGEKATVSFDIAISDDAITKEYPIKIVADYYDANGQSKQSTTGIFGILITKKSEFLVTDVEVFGTDAGGEGTIEVTIKNDGEEDVYSAVASLNLKSPFSILDNTAFIGDLKPEESKTALFKVQISEDASEKQYPLDVKISYEDTNHNKKEYTTATFGVSTEKKMDFEIVKVETDLEVGSKGLIEITFKNTGNEVVKDAVARISAVTPFSSTDDTAFLGMINPGETKVGKFQIKSDSDALSKEYALNSEIKYTSADGNTKIGDVMKAAFEVKPKSTNIAGITLAGVFFIVLIVFAVYYLKKEK